MANINHRLIRYFVLTVVIGAGLHFLYAVLPCLLAAVVSPVNESIWEHLKLVYFPFAAAALLYTRRERQSRPSWYAALLLSSALLLGFGWLYHVALGGESLGVDVVAYVLIMALGFYLGERLRVSERWHMLLRLICLILLVLIVLWTFWAPDHRLFADPALVDAFYTLPC